MHLDDGCSHFAAWEHDLRGLEPVIVNLSRWAERWVTV